MKVSKSIKLQLNDKIDQLDDVINEDLDRYDDIWFIDTDTWHHLESFIEEIKKIIEEVKN
jgi:hypothetical protein